LQREGEVPAVDNFFDAQSGASKVKAAIISKHFDAWSRIMLPSAKRANQKIVYMDLYCGPGRYDDGSKSTPLLVLDKAIANVELARRVVIIFNDENASHIAKLQAAVQNYPGIEKLAIPPAILNQTIGADTAQYFRKNPAAPTFTFIDPFGYASLTRDLIEGVTKNWGCECVFFFNYNRINAAISAKIFRERMAAIFGDTRAAELEKKIMTVSGKPHEREEAIVDALTEALEKLNNGDSYVRPFRFKKNNRTSHMLVFVTKDPKGYRVMNEIMAKEGFRDAKGIPFYTHHEDNVPATADLFHREFTDLKKMLLRDYAGKTRTMLQIYEEHSLKKNYISINYKDALNELEAEKKIEADPPAADRPKRNGRPTFGDNTKVTIP
jgi:three-Cys-motif partner protein